METLKGTVDHIIFHNDKNGYTVADFDVDGQMVTVVGNFEELKEGCLLYTSRTGLDQREREMITFCFLAAQGLSLIHI